MPSNRVNDDTWGVAMSYPTEGPLESNAPEPQQPGAGYSATERPWTVTSAAVIAFVFAAIALLAAIADFVWAAQANSIVVGLVNIMIAALFIWCGVSALRGVTSRSLFFLAVATIAVNIILIIFFAIRALTFWPNVVMIVLAVIIIALLVQQSSRQFFRAQGGTAI
jgi:hypothetical protein